MNTPRGTSRDYILARLERDGKSALLARVTAGELSAHAAALAAGYRKSPSTVDRLQRLWQKASVAERRRFRDWMRTETERES